MKSALLNTVLAIVFSGGHPSGPVTTYSAPAYNPGSDVVACIVQNLAAESVAVEAVLHHPGGGVADSGEAVVAPGHTVEIASNGDDLVGLYCSFSFDGDPTTVRGYVHRRPAVGGDTRALFDSHSRRIGSPSNVVTYSPPLRSLSADALACLVQNLAGRTIEVETALLDADGTVIDSSIIDLVADRAAVTVASTDDHLNAYCRFSFAAHDSELRGYAVLIGTSAASAPMVFEAFPADSAGDLAAYSHVVKSVASDATACIAQNLDDMPRMVGAQLIDSSGVLAVGGKVVQPGHIEQITGGTEAVDHGYCKFDFADDEDRVRGYITRFPMVLFANTDLLQPARTNVGTLQLVATYSPPVQVMDGQLQCLVENLTASDVSVHVEIDDGTGTIIAMTDVVVPAGEGMTALTTTEDLSHGFCTFTFVGDSGAVRAFAALANAAGTRTQLLFEASERGLTTFATPTPTETTTQRPTFTFTPSVTPVATATSTSRPTFTATAEPTATSTPTATGTFTIGPSFTVPPSATPTSTADDSPTSTPTSTSEPTATPPVPCVGDCDGDGMVTVDEILKMVNIALGAPIDECPAGDRNGDHAITVDEILAAVANALDGCP